MTATLQALGINPGALVKVTGGATRLVVAIVDNMHVALATRRGNFFPNPDDSDVSTVGFAIPRTAIVGDPIGSTSPATLKTALKRYGEATGAAVPQIVRDAQVNDMPGMPGSTPVTDGTYYVSPKSGKSRFASLQALWTSVNGSPAHEVDGSLGTYAAFAARAIKGADGKWTLPNGTVSTYGLPLGLQAVDQNRDHDTQREHVEVDGVRYARQADGTLTPDPIPTPQSIDRERLTLVLQGILASIQTTRQALQALIETL